MTIPNTNGVFGEGWNNPLQPLNLRSKAASLYNLIPKNSMFAGVAPKLAANYFYPENKGAPYVEPTPATQPEDKISDAEATLSKLEQPQDDSQSSLEKLMASLNFSGGVKNYVPESTKTNIAAIKSLTKPNPINRERGFSGAEKATMIGQGLGSLFDAFDKSHEGQGSWKNEDADNLLNMVQNRLAQDKENKFQDAIRNQGMDLDIQKYNQLQNQQAIQNQLSLAELMSNTDFKNSSLKNDAEKAKLSLAIAAIRNNKDDSNSDKIAGLTSLLGNLYRTNKKSEDSKHFYEKPYFGIFGTGEEDPYSQSLEQLVKAKPFF